MFGMFEDEKRFSLTLKRGECMSILNSLWSFLSQHHFFETMKFSTAILALAAFLSAVNAVPLDRRDDIIPGLLKARDTAQVRGRGRVAITRDEVGTAFVCPHDLTL